METDDDTIVLIVIDDEEKEKINRQEDMLSQLESLESSLLVNNIIETAKKHGQYIALDEKSRKNDCDYYEGLLQDDIKSENSSQGNSVKEECLSDFEEIIKQVGYSQHSHNQLVDKFKSSESVINFESGNDYEENLDNSQTHSMEEDDPEIEENSQNSIKRRQHRAPVSEISHSFVAELRDKYPDLKEDETLLIDTLEEIMRNVKPPPPPRDFYIMNSINFECIECAHLSETQQAAARHYQEKHGERYLVCYACGADFRSTTNFYKHERRCTAPDAGIVLRARRACMRSKARSKSAKNENKKASFSCQYCSAMFMAHASLKAHENLHRGVRPYRCQECTCAYTSYYGLARHAKKHTNIQYICDHCGRSFKVKNALVIHLDTHRPLRRHACDECDRRFAQKAALVIHVNKVHRNLPPPCTCQICPKRYFKMSLLKDHMKRAHGMSIITRTMFFKSLPTMTNLEVNSKVIHKSQDERREQIPDSSRVHDVDYVKNGNKNLDAKNLAKYLYNTVKSLKD